MPANQLLVTLEDGRQVAIMAPGIGSLDHVRVITREKSWAMWSPALPEAPQGGTAHVPSTYHIGEW